MTWRDAPMSTYERTGGCRYKAIFDYHQKVTETKRGSWGSSLPEETSVISIFEKGKKEELGNYKVLDSP